MKVATLRDGSRDGRLVVVSHDLTLCSDARHIAPTLQAALDRWAEVAPQLELIARGIATGGQPVERFHERDARSPLPFADPTATTGFADPRQALGEGASGVSPGLAAIVGQPAEGSAVRLVMLAGAVDVQGSDATAFSPVAVTPEELVPGLLVVELNGAPFSRTTSRSDPAALAAEAGPAGAADSRIRLGPATDAVVRVPLSPGDSVRLEIRDGGGHSIFGAIERRVS